MKISRNVRIGYWHRSIHRLFVESSRRPLGVTSDKANIADLQVKTPYESQILTRLTHFTGGLRIENYPFVTSECETLTMDFYKNVFLASFTSPKQFLKKIDVKMKQCNVGDNYECDLYVQLPYSDDELNIEQLLQDSTESVFSLNNFEPDNVNVAGKWVLVEISESAQHLAHKLYQLERAMHLLPRAASDFAKEDVGALIVLLNGKREHAEMAINYVKLNEALMISRVPVFVGWVPFRNLFVTITDVQGQVGQMDKRITGLTDEVKRRVGELDYRIGQLEYRVGQLVQSIDRLVLLCGVACVLAIVNTVVSMRGNN